MEIPVRINQTWRQKWSPQKRKFASTPIVMSMQNWNDRMKTVKREVWFDFIKKGWLPVNNDLRRWLDDNGFSDIKHIQ